MTWQGGGGYGDPMTREQTAVPGDRGRREAESDRRGGPFRLQFYGVIVRGGLVNLRPHGPKRDPARATAAR